MRAAKQDENISAFLSFSPIYRWDIFDHDHYYEVRFIDLRYRSKDYYPFVAIVQLDHNLNIISSYTGWIFSEEKLRKTGITSTLKSDLSRFLMFQMIFLIN